MQLEEQFGQAFVEYVCLVQKHAKGTNPVHLCFAPIGTNMMMLASEISINVKLRRRTVTMPGAWDFDEEYIREFNRQEGTEHSVLPWVLQRFDNHHSDTNPWTIWFEDLAQNDLECDDFEIRAAELEARLASIRPRIAQPHLIELGVCTDYVSRLNSKSMAMIDQQVRVSDKGCVGVHIRRGDASNEATDEADPGRRHFTVDRYIEEMEDYLKRGYGEFYLLTESQLEIDRVTDHFDGRCRILAQPIDRKQFPNLSGKKHGKANFIEYLCLDNPDLVKFSMDSALVDLENAGRCDAFIGSFESAFSNLAYLKSVGRHRRNVEHTDLADGTFGKALFYPNLAKNRGTSLFVIKERDVGFFSLFLQVVNTLLYLRNEKANAIPIVQFSDKQEYFSGSETWEDFFEPLVFLNKLAIQNMLDRVNASFLHHMSEMKYWDRTGIIYDVRRSLSWSGSYYPGRHAGRLLSRLKLKLPLKLLNIVKPRSSHPSKLSTQGTRLYVSHEVVPTQEDRRNASDVIGKYINLKPEIQDKVDGLFRDYDDHYIIGVQFRGTDARKDERRAIPAYDHYVDVIKRHLEERDPSDSRKVFIFVASDEDDFIRFLSGQFDNVGHFEAIRHTADAGDEQSGGKLGWGMPAFIRVNRKKALEGAILDYAGLCRSHYMIHNFGSLTNAVLLTCPDIGNHLVGADYQQVESGKR